MVLVFSCHTAPSPHTTIDTYHDINEVKSRLANSWLLFPTQIHISSQKLPEQDTGKQTTKNIREKNQKLLDSVLARGLYKTRPHQKVFDYKKNMLTFPQKIRNGLQAPSAKITDSLLNEISHFTQAEILVVPTVTTLQMAPTKNHEDNHWVWSQLTLNTWDTQANERLAVIHSKIIFTRNQSPWEKLFIQRGDLDIFHQLAIESWQALPLSVTDRFLGKP